MNTERPEPTVVGEDLEDVRSNEGLDKKIHPKQNSMEAVVIDWNRLLNITVAGEAATRSNTSELLPDFCRGELVVRVVFVAQLLALVISVLVADRYFDSMFRTFIMVSLFVQWVALSSVALLCVLRGWLNSLPPERTFLFAYLLLVITTLLITELLFWMLHWLGVLPSARPEDYVRTHVQNIIVSLVANALLLRYLIGREDLRRITLLEASARSEVQKYRIRPHFLFNTMNVTAGLLRKSPAKAESAIMDLADLFRMMLDDNKPLVSVIKEIDLAKKYLSLERLRLDDRLSCEWDEGEISRFARTPVQILQLLLEHAIHIGIDPLADGGTIGITIGADENEVRIRIECPDSPAVAGVLEADKTQDADGQVEETGISRGARNRESDTTTLDNIRLRLTDHYASSGELQTHVEQRDGLGLYIITVRHPASGDTDSEDTNRR